MSNTPAHSPSYWTAERVRAAFLDFYKDKHAHAVVPSSPVVPHDDPTLLFANAGMNQFKPIFLGDVPPGSPLAGLKRAVNTQKCIRAGGKHNDLDDVGRDTYHHTFFEMLGTWSFGDYFKKESIRWGIELLTKVFGIPTDRLYATYFQGEPSMGLEPDLEAKAIWEGLLPPGHVLPGNMKDNFWEMGETGPCGPCSEIHFDRIGDRNAARLVNSGDPDVLEVWNHVFIQFNRESATVLRPLPAKHVDTGMGFERLVSVLQNKRSNYDTDVFFPLFRRIEELTGNRHQYRGKLGAQDHGNVDTAFRVIADHIRTLTFAITDGALPSNEGRGYVLRRVLRRAVRYGRQTLGLRPGFFAQLVPTVVETFGDAFPELRKDPARVEGIIREEEDSFGKTLDRGIKLFEDDAFVAAHHKMRLMRNNWLSDCLKAQVELGGAGANIVAGFIDKCEKVFGEMLGENPLDEPWGAVIQRIQSTVHSLRARAESLGKEVSGICSAPKSVDLMSRINAATDRFEQEFVAGFVISSAAAFKLYDTYGFPIDLTQQMAEERGMTVDMAGFERLMEEQRDRARAAQKAAGGGAETAHLHLGPAQTDSLHKLNVKPTEDVDKFHGRDIRARVKAIWNGTNFDQAQRPGTARVGRAIGVVLDRTNFYSEMGGQVADTGSLTVMQEAPGAHDTHDGGEFRVDDARAFGGYVLHIGHVVRGEIRVGDVVKVSLDAQRRHAVASNHTATHLLNLALRETLGDGADQKGSLVAPDKLRFDFSYGRPVTPDELTLAQAGVRKRIAENLEVYAELAPQTLARTVKGLRAVFGEAYPDPVRVVSIGAPVPKLLDEPQAERWTNYSVEFCGGTHVGSTGDIGDFVLASEEGIAKGVRRIIALTGVPARAAIKASDELDRRVEAAKDLEGAALMEEVASISSQVDELTLPAPRKHAIREALTVYTERIKADQKQAAAGRASDAAKIARQIGEAAASSLLEVVVNTIECGSDRKALQAAVNTVQQLCPKAAVMLFSPDPDEGKIAIMAVVPPAMVKRGVSAGEWVRAASEACGGKGGGRPDNASGGGSDLAKLKDAIGVATAWANKKLF